MGIVARQRNEKDGVDGWKERKRKGKKTMMD